MRLAVLQRRIVRNQNYSDDMGKRRTTIVEQLTRNELQMVVDMQRDLDYLTQFVVNVPILLMGRKPAILSNCSDDVEALCNKCWDECLKAAEKIYGKTEGVY